MTPATDGVPAGATVAEFLGWLDAEDLGDDPSRIRREAWSEGSLPPADRAGDGRNDDEDRERGSG